MRLNILDKYVKRMLSAGNEGQMSHSLDIGSKIARRVGEWGKLDITQKLKTFILLERVIYMTLEFVRNIYPCNTRI